MHLAVLADLWRAFELVPTEVHPPRRALDNPLHLLAGGPVVVHLQVPLPRAADDRERGHADDGALVREELPNRPVRVGSDGDGVERAECGRVERAGVGGRVCGGGGGTGTCAYTPDRLPL
jgi:hypothetical protein